MSGHGQEAVSGVWHIGGVMLLVLVVACGPGESDSGLVIESVCPEEDLAGHTVGLLSCESGASGGYTLIAPLESTTTWLVDAVGREVHRWEAESPPGSGAWLMEDGLLLRAATLAGHPIFDRGGAGGIVQALDWDGEVVWDVRVNTATTLSHHDFTQLPSGNVLLLAWEWISEDEALAAGRIPAVVDSRGLWSEWVVELTPEGEAVWEWHAWDHKVQSYDADLPDYGASADHPGKLDLNPPGNGPPDWLHFSAVDHHPELDLVMLTSGVTAEVLVIDHDTTTAEAAGPAGDLLWRWGNPLMYGSGDGDDQFLHGAHDGHWIPPGRPGEGHVLAFDNGIAGRVGQLSRVVEAEVPVDSEGVFSGYDGRWGPEEATWLWPDPVDGRLDSGELGGAQRLPGGNTLICEGEWGRILEVTPGEEVVWVYVNPITGEGAVKQGEEVPPGWGVMANALFRAQRVPSDHPGLAGR